MEGRALEFDELCFSQVVGNSLHQTSLIFLTPSQVEAVSCFR